MGLLEVKGEGEENEGKKGIDKKKRIKKEYINKMRKN